MSQEKELTEREQKRLKRKTFWSRLPLNTEDYDTNEKIIDALKKLYPGEDAFIEKAVKNVRGGRLAIVPDTGTEIVCPKSAGPRWEHVVLVGVSHDNAVLGYNMFYNYLGYGWTAAHGEKDVSYFIDGDKMIPSPSEREPLTMYATPSKEEFEQLISVLNPKQLNLLKKWVNQYSEYSKTEEFKEYNGRNGETGDVSVIKDCIKNEETKRAIIAARLHQHE